MAQHTQPGRVRWLAFCSVGRWIGLRWLHVAPDALVQAVTVPNPICDERAAGTPESSWSEGGCKARLRGT